MNYEYGHSHRKSILVNDEGDLCLSCGGEILNDLPYKQTSPLLPLTRPRTLKSLKKKPLNQTRTEPYRGDTLAGFSSDITVSTWLRNPKVDESKRYNLKYSKEKYGNYLKHFNIFTPQQYGLENYFNGSCVKAVDDLILYTGIDGVLNIGKFEAFEDSSMKNLHFPSFYEIASCTEERLNFSRIYEVDCKQSGGNYLCLARYKNGFSFFNFDCETASASPIISIPSSAGAISHCFLESGSSLLLDINSNVSLLDLETTKVTLSTKVDCGVENFSWGVISQGRDENCMTIGARKSTGLLDLRAGSVQMVKTFGEKMYLRSLCTDRGYWYISTDEYIEVYDLRNLTKTITLPLQFDYSKIVQCSSVHLMNNKSWVLASTLQADISLNVLDFSHNNCQNTELVDSSVKISCRRDKVPDLYGAGRHLKGWNDTVASARLSSDVWLESTVEQRANIEFRGHAVHHQIGGSTASVLTVNAVGDLFTTTLSFNITEDEDMNVDDEHDEYIEEWGREVFETTQMKYFYAASTVKTRKKIRYHKDKRKLKKKKSLDTPKKAGEKKQLELPSEFKKKLNRSTYFKKLDYSKFESGISSNIIKILAPYGVESRKTESEVEGDSDGGALPPEEEDPGFALRSFFEDLGVPSESQNVQNLSRYSFD